MTTESSKKPRANRDDLTTLDPLRLPAGEKRTRAAQKGAATARRHSEARRADTLAEMRAQIANGTLIVRQMTAEQHRAAAQAACRTLARNKARREHRAGDLKRDP